MNPFKIKGQSSDTQTKRYSMVEAQWAGMTVLLIIILIQRLEHKKLRKSLEMFEFANAGSDSEITARIVRKGSPKKKQIREQITDDDFVPKRRRYA